MLKNINEEILFPFLSENYRIENCRFKWFFHKNHNIPTTTKTHHHMFYEVHFVRQGQMTYQVGAEEIGLAAGQYLVFAPDTPHKRTHTSPDAITCHMTYALSGSAYRNIGSGWTKDTASESLQKAFYHTAQELADTPSVFRMDVSLQALRLISLLSSEAMQTDAGFAKIDNVDTRVLMAKAFIKKNVRQNITCKDVAEHCYLSGKQMSRLFLRHEGISLKAYIDKKRAQEAMRLVGDHSLSLMQISEKMHFCNEYYFNRFFKKHAGMCPGEYRSGQM